MTPNGRCNQVFCHNKEVKAKHTGILNAKHTSMDVHKVCVCARTCVFACACVRMYILTRSLRKHESICVSDVRTMKKHITTTQIQRSTLLYPLPKSVHPS